MRKILPDLLKGWAVLWMIQVHLMELFMPEAVYQSLWGRISLFLGGPPAAPVFMAVMGYFLARPAVKAAGLALRGLKLLLWGLLLNLGLNLHVLFRYFFRELQLDPLRYLFGVDILFLAGFSLLFIAILKPLLKDRLLLWLLLAAGIAFFGDRFPVLANSSGPLQYLAAYLGGNYPWSYFPLIPWLAYPLTGYAAWMLERKYSLGAASGRYFSILLLLMILSLLITLPWAVSISHHLPSYYHHGLPFFGWTLLFLCCYTLLISKMNRLNFLRPLHLYLGWLGRNVTSVYVFQWLLIGNLATLVYKSQPAWTFLPWFVVITVVVTGLTRLWEKRKSSNNVL
ncbi:MAG TPA: acyltransferase family protein [Bacteroidales bacterium]|nr:acyltransferase family protein [Bacteroidales bacterium]HSA42165.1 acyltransferase family protein [Bacteroidales bacterium]